LATTGSLARDRAAGGSARAELSDPFDRLDRSGANLASSAESCSRSSPTRSREQTLVVGEQAVDAPHVGDEVVGEQREPVEVAKADDLGVGEVGTGELGTLVERTSRPA